MEVSNSTGRNTDYRVGASAGGGMNSVVKGGSSLNSSNPGSAGEMTLTSSGELPPGGSVTCSAAGSFQVQFSVGGVVVASASYGQDPGLVTLVERDGRYVIEAQSDCVAA